MNRVIWKYLIKPDAFTIEMPAGARILTVMEQFGAPQLWALVDPTAEMERRYFVAIQTGREFFVKGATYVGTMTANAGAVIIHLFEYTRESAIGAAS
jgi:hypothetical protein